MDAIEYLGVVCQAAMGILQHPISLFGHTVSLWSIGVGTLVVGVVFDYIRGVLFGE